MVTEKVAKTVLGGVVNPLGHPDCAGTCWLKLLLLLKLLLRHLILLVNHLLRHLWQTRCRLRMTRIISCSNLIRCLGCHRISRSWSLYLDNLRYVRIRYSTTLSRDWSRLCSAGILTRSCIMLHRQIRLNHHLWRVLSGAFRRERLRWTTILRLHCI